MTTDVLAPAHLVMVVLLVVGAASASSILAGLGWGMLAALFAGIAPYTVILVGVRRGLWSDRHIRVRHQRLVPLVLAVISVGVGLLVLIVAGCPRPLLALVLAMLAGLLVTLAVTVVWQISVHTAVAAGTAVVLGMTFSSETGIAAGAAVAAIGWSRVHLRHHTMAQVVAGTVMGAVAAFLVYGSIR